MTQMQSPVDVGSAREIMEHLSERDGIFARSAHVLELVAHNSIGLGEVLQDCARQACTQLRDVMDAADHIVHGAGKREDAEIVGNIHFVFKIVKSVLEMTPVAMHRNKAGILGEKEKITSADVARMADDFLHSRDVECLLADENSGQVLAALVAA